MHFKCPRSSVDRAVASGAMCAGSIPAGGTTLKKFIRMKLTQKSDKDTRFSFDLKKRIY